MSVRTYEQISDLPAGITPVTGAELVELEQDGVSRKFTMTELGGITAEHQGTHQFGSTDPVGTHDKVANAIPYLNASGLIDDHVTDASTTAKGKVQLASDGESAASKAVQADDGRLSNSRAPTAHASSHYGVGDDLIPPATTEASGLMSNADKTKLDSVDLDNLPTAEEKGALAGTYGTPSETNKFVTDLDPRLEEDPVDVADIIDWASFDQYTGIEIATGQTSRQWQAMASHDGELYACVNGGDIYKQDISGVFQPTGQTSRVWYGLASHNGYLYACAVGGDSTGGVYKMDGSGVFQQIDSANRNWYGMASHGGNLYVAVGSGDVYVMDVNETFQPTGQTSRTWFGLASHDGYLYASVSQGDIYKMDLSGTFQATSQTNRYWTYLASHDGNLYASVESGSGSIGVYVMVSNVFQKIGLELSWEGLVSHDGDLYAAAHNGDIYNLSNTSPSINVPTARNVFIHSSFPLGGRKVIRRLSAYDGNAVILYPPTGATFEGRASISLYGKYSFVEIERISATVFAVRDLRDGASTATGEWIAKGDGTLLQWGYKGAFAAGTNATIVLPRAYNPSYQYSLSGSVTPSGMWEPFLGYTVSEAAIAIRSLHSDNTYKWQTIGKW